jgi:hypothetical protein
VEDVVLYNINLYAQQLRKSIQKLRPLETKQEKERILFLSLHLCFSVFFLFSRSFSLFSRLSLSVYLEVKDVVLYNINLYAQQLQKSIQKLRPLEELVLAKQEKE